MLQHHQRPISARLDNNSHAANHRNSNHNILSSNGQSFNNSYNNHRPGNAISVGGGPCSGGIDCVDNSNTLLAAGTPLLPPELHTPSETSETSSSSEPSSSGEEWESGECDQVTLSDNNSSSSKKRSSCCSSDKIICDVVTVDRKYDLHYCKDQQRKLYYSDDNYYCGSSVAVAQTQSQQQQLPDISTTSTEGNFDSNNCNTNNASSSMTRILSQRKKFKAKTGNVKVVSHTNPIIGKKMKWLANMKSDPDFRETLNKNVHFRSTGMSPGRNSNDSLDYYSSICDKQLSFGSPCKSPGELIRLGNLSVTKEECSDIVVATKKSPIIPVFDVPPNTPTTPKEISCPPQELDRKSPAKSESNFKTRFFNFGRRDSNTHDKPIINVEEPPISSHNLLPVIHVQHSNSAPQIPSNRDNNRENSNNSNSSSNSSSSHRCSPFSFRELRQEIQSAIKNHQHQPNHKHDENSSKNHK